VLDRAAGTGLNTASPGFLASDKVPVYYFNTWYDIRIVQVGNTIAVSANGLPLTRFTDRQAPYTEGSVGLYAEDAYAQFGDIRIQPANPSSLTDLPSRSTPLRG
jgi:Domain of Unknown Function (DUF1080)